MHLPLIIAILAFLALALLPALDRSASLENQDKGMRAYTIRLARWLNE